MYLKEYIIILLSCSNIVGDIQGEIRLCLHFWIVWYKSYAELEKSAFGHTITGINRIIPRGYFTTLVFFSKITFAKWIQYRKPSRAIFLTLDASMNEILFSRTKIIILYNFRSPTRCALQRFFLLFIYQRIGT